jgi:hypothetical protein
MWVRGSPYCEAIPADHFYVTKYQAILEEISSCVEVDTHFYLVTRSTPNVAQATPAYGIRNQIIIMLNEFNLKY